jgi:Zinc-finger of C2H2 type
MCVDCKDQFVQFFIFKDNLKLPQNNTKLIYSQIDDFLSSKDDVYLSRIKIIRTINSITLQYDEEPKVQRVEEITIKEAAENIFEDLEAIDDEITCPHSNCERTEASEIDLEIHEFLKHSSFGVELENAIENSKEVFFNFLENEATNTAYSCKICDTQLENGDILLLHILEDHCFEIIEHINTILNIPYVVDVRKVANFLNTMYDCINGNNQELSIDPEIRNYFYDTYNSKNKVVNNEEEDDEVLGDDAFDSQDIQEQSDIEMQEESTKKEEIKRNEATADDKEWLRNEILCSKLSMTDDNGAKGTVYRCMVHKNCDYLSNSSQGLRYHLMMKHMKDRHLYVGQRKEEFVQLFEEQIPPHIAERIQNTNKNFCVDCSLKFKDNRGHALHEKCHELFSVLATHISFPSCNTCNVRFIDESALNKHLLKHKRDEILGEPIEVSNGAVREQGKLSKSTESSISNGETTEATFSVKCGHCESKHFTSEEYCNFHLLMNHVSCFSCPIDKMEFKGFKCVSLFIHHLRNKHSELFPNVSFKCTFCHTNFPSIYDKLQHMKICDSKKFQCDHCEKRFFKKNDLSAHLRIVSGEVQFECELSVNHTLKGLI